VVSVKGKAQQLDVIVGPKFRSLVLYSPNPANARGGGGGGRGRGTAPEAPQAASTGPVIPLNGANGSLTPRDFIAFEPMVGITDSMNLSQKGIYKELQSVPPGGTWQESFWIRPKGF
jgi:aldose 1-epimerase